MQRRPFLLLSALPMPFLAARAHAAGFPDRPVRVIVAYPAGGTADIMARLVAAEMAEPLGQPVVVENRPGSSGVVGTEHVARAAPDGTTIMLGSVATHAMNPAIFRQLPYDAITGFTPLALLAETPNVVVVNPATPFRTVGDLVAAARAQPGALNFGSTSIGGTPHMSGVLLEMRTGIRLNHVPYRGSAPMLADLIGGHVPLAFDNLPAAVGGIRDGRLRALAVTTAARAPALPDVPTMQESGVPDYDVSSWFGMYGPAGLPREIAARLEQVILAALGKPSVRSRMLDLGSTPVAGDGAALARKTAAELAMWTEVVRAAGIPRQ